MAYEINPNDERLVAVNREEEQALNKTNTMYNSMIANSDKYYNEQIEASKDWADKQTQLQQEKTDFAIEKIEQEKDKANKDYIKEQSGAYVDWQKESNRYGVNAEQMAAQGLANTGYSESSQVSMYNTYQNRVSSARETYNNIVLNYNNAITDARLQNNSVLAEIAYEALQQQLELSLQGFQYKNQLIETQANKMLEIKNMYHSQYMDVLNQINEENRLQEELRQFNATYSLQQQQLREEIRQFDEEIARLKAKDAQEYALEIKQLEQQKAIADAQLAEEQRQFNALQAQKTSSSGSSGGSSKINKPSGSGSSGGSNSRGIGMSAVNAVNKDDTDGNKSNTNASGNNKATMQSIINLGYGPISAKGLAEKVAMGLVKEGKDSNGNPVFYKAGPINQYERNLLEKTLSKTLK